MRKFISTSLVSAGFTSLILSTAALADGPAGGSTKDAAPADEGRKFAYSWNIGVASDYIFRGVSQNGRDPAFQAGVDVSYGILYAGIWGSDVNFGRNNPGVGPIANVEVDYYGGIKPVWGPLTFDFGVIYYNYLGGNDRGPKFGQARDQDYVEWKAGVSATFIPKLTTGFVAYFAPQYIGGQGFVTTLEGTAAYELPKIGQVVPTVSGLLGGSFGDASDRKDPFTAANGKDQYVYWNAGITFALDKLSVDFRYWDTDIQNNGRIGNNFCRADVFGCDGRAMGTVKVTF